MEKNNSSPEVKNFARKIAVVEILIFLVAGVVAFSLRINFSIILFVLGITIAAIGARLVSPRAFQPRDPRLQQLNPNEKASIRILDNVRGSLPHYAFENTLFFAGLIALSLSLPFICQIMF